MSTANTEKYNNLPIEVRKICQITFLEDQIRDLTIEKIRTTRHYKAHIKEINEHIKNCERDLKKYESEVGK